MKNVSIKGEGYKRFQNIKNHTLYPERVRKNVIVSVQNDIIIVTIVIFNNDRDLVTSRSVDTNESFYSLYKFNINSLYLLIFN